MSRNTHLLEEGDLRVRPPLLELARDRPERRPADPPQLAVEPSPQRSAPGTVVKQRDLPEARAAVQSDPVLLPDIYVDGAPLHDVERVPLVALPYHGGPRGGLLRREDLDELGELLVRARLEEDVVPYALEDQHLDLVGLGHGDADVLPLGVAGHDGEAALLLEPPLRRRLLPFCWFFVVIVAE